MTSLINELIPTGIIKLLEESKYELFMLDFNAIELIELNELV